MYLAIERPSAPNPGSCVMRLNGIEYMSQQGKTELLQSISDDLRALLMCVGRHVDAGNLDARSTAPLDEVISTIRDTEIGYRRSLEKRLRRTRKQKRRLRREYRGIVRSTDALARAYKAKVQALKDEVRRLRGDIIRLEGEVEMWRMAKGKGAVMEERTDSGDRGMAEMGEESGKAGRGCDAAVDAAGTDTDTQFGADAEVDAVGEWENGSAERGD